MFLARCVQPEFTLKHVDKALCRGGPKHSTRAKFSSHLRKARTQLRRNVNYKLHALCTGKRRTDECIRRLQQMIRLQAASCESQMMQA